MLDASKKRCSWGALGGLRDANFNYIPRVVHCRVTPSQSNAARLPQVSWQEREARILKVGSSSPLGSAYLMFSCIVYARKIGQSTCGLVAMTSASHAEGRQFDPGQVYALTRVTLT